MGKALVTGIDIGHYSIKAVVIRASNAGLELLRYKELPISEGIFADNHTLDHQRIVKKLKELKRLLPWRSHKVAVSIPDSAVSSKSVQVEQGSEGRELEFSIAQAFGQVSPIPVEALDFDFYPVAEQRSQRSTTLTYQVHATRKEVLESRLKALKKVGFQTVVADIHGHALSHLWQLAKQMNNSKQDWMLVDVGFQHTSLCCIPLGRAPFYKEVPFGLQELTPEMELAPPLEGEHALNAFAHKLAERLKRQISLFNSVNAQQPVAGIWLCGGGAMYPQLMALLKRQLQLDVNLLAPFSLVTNKTKLPSKQLVDNAIYSAAMGIALSGIAWQQGARHDEH